MPRLDKKGESIDLLGADALNAVIDDTTIVTYQAIRRGVERGAKILRKAVRKKNFGWRDKSGRLRRSVRLAKVKGFFVEGAGRRVRVKPYAAVVIGDYRQYSKTYAPHAHLVARGYTSGGRVRSYKRKSTGARVKGYVRGGGPVRGKLPLQRAFISSFSAIQSVIRNDFEQDFTKEMEKEIRRVYRGQLRKLVRGERTV